MMKFSTIAPLLLLSALAALASATANNIDNNLDQLREPFGEIEKSFSKNKVQNVNEALGVAHKVNEHNTDPSKQTQLDEAVDLFWAMILAGEKCDPSAFEVADLLGQIAYQGELVYLGAFVGQYFHQLEECQQ